uniref:SRCR domain-containing protein n=1 Tax=Dicentrarchus labrax TaxID=13489 RepID=A0A8P4GU11_DICLA
MMFDDIFVLFVSGVFFSLSILSSIICPDSVRLVDGTSPCSGRLLVKSDQSNQWWSSVCEDDFDQQDAEVVCRELGCGAPSVLQGSLYGEVEAPMWTKEFQCGGHESALLDCRSSGSARNTCSPGKAVGLTCSESEEVRLVGGDSRCAGTLELKHNGDWRPVMGRGWNLKAANVVCRNLDCGSAVSVGERKESSVRPVWLINFDCVQSGSSLRKCATSESSSSILNLTCSGKPISDIINDIINDSNAPMLTHTQTHTVCFVALNLPSCINASIPPTNKSQQYVFTSEIFTVHQYQ